MTNEQKAAIAMLKLANNGVTMAQSVEKKHLAAINELIAIGIVEKTTSMMYGFGAMPAYKFA
jgi:hypothetical protein